jgi:hypothetical protein
MLLPAMAKTSGYGRRYTLYAADSLAAVWRKGCMALSLFTFV